ncbi:beta-lactamase/transpeptidase-like protein [Trematosphaeria pertusa]|uniref:Beta-lactamase/transpeptidase-like protein n=1 Tax=Trematosphaeria pertusa TaxID=390896 RepID=A0A6A6IGX0_9PLEO|nr:beta-lactamase/transpeptidase-like protein [Trematosphaeria pertusa]KAF2249656.1 beta-lactamase/transpeptidase-like protein [Trematosphaeria pertusa]
MTDSRPQQDDYFAAYGTLQLDPTTAPVVTNTVMWFASCTKLPTTVAALQCVERGLIDLDSPADVDRLLPEWSDPQILTEIRNGEPVLTTAKEKMTLRRLLTHTSGMAYDFHPPLLEWRQSRGERPLTLRGPITQAHLHPLVFEPGTGFTYGPGLELAGLMVARANGCTLEEYMRKNIFDVLGMDDSSFRPHTHQLAERVMPMTARSSPDGPLADGQHPPPIAKALTVDPEDDSGGGGLFSTAEDFLKLLKAILRNDGRLLKPESIDLMFRPSLSSPSQTALNELFSDPTWAAYMIPGEPPIGTEGAGEWTHGIGGLIGLTSKEDGLKSPWLQMGGAPNLDWWIDRQGGSCGIFATQLSPRGEAKHQPLKSLFQHEMVKKFSKED